MKRLSFLLAIWLLLAGCAPTARPPSQRLNRTPFLPPTQAIPTNSPASTETISQAALARSTPTVACEDNLTFIHDLTIPDGTVVGPDSTLDKRWEVENSGNCNWNEFYRVRLIAGDEMGTQSEQALFPARSGSRAMIRIQFKAPSEPGAYQSAWQAFDSLGEPFGDPFFIDIVVSDL